MVMNGNGNCLSIDVDETVFCLNRFCPSVFFYLCTVIPSVWFLELDLAGRRSRLFNATQVSGLIPTSQGSLHLENEDTLPVRFVSVLLSSIH